MTEKRFILVDDFEWWSVIDTTGEIRENEYSEKISGQIVVDLLNGLYCSNLKLLKSNDFLLKENEPSYALPF